MLACSHVYPGVRHILCRWHVDRYTALYTCTMATLICILFCRAWQRKLRSLVKNEHHQAELYACLWMLISEQDENDFLHNQDVFLSYWQDKEPDFVAYYRHEYFDRAGLPYSHSTHKTIANYCILQKSGLCAIVTLIIAMLIPTCSWRGLYDDIFVTLINPVK